MSSSLETDKMMEENGEDSKGNKDNDGWEEYFLTMYHRYFPVDTRPWLCPVDYSYEDHKGVLRKYELTSVSSRIFVTLETSDSCKLGSYIYQLVMAVIILNIIVNVLMTLPNYRNVPVSSCSSPACDNDATLCPGETVCEPAVEPYLNEIDDWCVILFSIEYGLRVLTVCTVANRLAGLIPRGFDEEERIFAEMENRAVRDPKQMTWYRTLYCYCTTARNIIDFVAILPFYITLIDPGNSSSLSFIRILRLFRVLRAFNGGANTGVINMIGKTVKSSMEIIIFVLMIMTLFVFIYGSIIFSLESGTYVVNSDYPNGAYVLKNSEGDYFRSSVTDTFTGMYWAVITMTTVGYGDIVPHTDIGKLVSVTCAFVGILFMALPIAILGSKVTLEYAKLEGKSKVEKEQRRLAIVERRLSRTGGRGASAKLQKVREGKIHSSSASTAAAKDRATVEDRDSPLTQVDVDSTSYKTSSPPQSAKQISVDASSTKAGEVELAGLQGGALGTDMDSPRRGATSVKHAVQNLNKNAQRPVPLMDQRKLAEAAGEVEARYELENDANVGLFGKRRNVGTDALELVISRLVEDLTDDDMIIGSKDRKQSLEELMRHLKGLSEAVKADLEADYRRSMLLVDGAEVLLHAASKTHSIQLSISEAAEDEVDGSDVDQ